MCKWTALSVWNQPRWTGRSRQVWRVALLERLQGAWARDLSPGTFPRMVVSGSSDSTRCRPVRRTRSEFGETPGDGRNGFTSPATREKHTGLRYKEDHNHVEVENA